MKKRIKVISFILTFLVVTSAITPNFPPLEVQAALVGESGTIPAGGTTGVNGGVSFPGGYRVGLVSEKMKDQDIFEINESNDSIYDKIDNQYSNHFPNLENSILFIPSSIYTTNSVIAWYNSSTGGLEYHRPSDSSYTNVLRKLDAGNTFEGSLFFDALDVKAPYADPSAANYDDLTKGCDAYDSYLDCKLGDDKWKDLVDWSASGCAHSCAVNAQRVWNYILEDTTDVVRKLRNYIDENNADSDKANDQWTARLHYLDALMTLWVMAPVGEEQNFYSAAIDRFIRGDDLGARPLLIAIDTVSRFSVPGKLGSTKMYIPSIHFVQYAHGGTSKARLTSPDFDPGEGALWDTEKLITAAANQSIAELKDRERLTNLTGEAYKQNGFAWGYSGVTGGVFRTNKGYGEWFPSGSVTSPIMKQLVFHGKEFGFIVAGGPQNKPQAECKCAQRAYISNRDSLKTNIGWEGTIGQVVSMAIDMNLSDKEIGHWEDALEGATNISWSVQLFRKDREGGNGSEAVWTGQGDAPAPVTGEGVGQPVTFAELKPYFEGTQTLSYNDDLTEYPLADGQTVTFAYNAEIRILYTDASGKELEKICNTPLTDANSPTVTFTSEEKAPEIGYFTSLPSYWSEIKQGSPQWSSTGSDEAFEAMAGTPTTRNLYFASGGSEFIVDIQVEYVPKASATRTYTSHFSPVINGWAMEPIEGSISHGKQPPAPAPRTKVDASGASYTEKMKLVPTHHTLEPAVPCSGDPCTGGKPEKWETDYHWVQEGYDSHLVGGYTDTWTQTVTFDYMKIDRVHVWKLDQSKVNGMSRLIGTEEVTASVVQGDPTVFANIAKNNTSAAGRLRYSLETNQHDAVMWEEGPSDNSLTNSKDSGPINEQKKFTERRKLTTNVTAVSDFLILQTSSGDRSVLYFQKASPTQKVTDPLEVPETGFDAMWTDNPYSAAKWDPRTTIPIGSYNGNYADPGHKYSAGGGAAVSTIFDTRPAGLNRPARPTGAMRLMNTGVMPLRTIPNGEYRTGTATVFYKYLPIPNSPGGAAMYQTTNNAAYHANGQDFLSAYSPAHSKVNDIVIHDPVSVEEAIVYPLDPSRDQRTDDAKAIGGNLQQPTVEYDKVLDPNFRQNILGNGDAESINSDKTVLGWTTWASIPGAGTEFGSRTGDEWVIEGKHSFEIRTVPNPGGTGTDHIGVYSKEVAVKPNTHYRFSGKISCHRCVSEFYLDLYNKDGTLDRGQIQNGQPRGYTPTLVTIDFTTGPNAGKVAIRVVKGEGTADSVAGSYEYMFADDLRLQNMSTQEFIPVEGNYKTVLQSIPNPDYIPPQPSIPQTFDYTGGVQTYTAPSDGAYTLEVWGAEGGTSGYGGKGGYSKGQVHLTKGQKLNVYVGGQTGWNGGGSGHGRDSDSGGGGTDMRLVDDESASVAYEWDFTDSLDGFGAGSASVSLADGSYLKSNGGYDAYFHSPVISFTGSAGDLIEITLKSQSSGSHSQIYFTGTGGGYSEYNTIRFTTDTKMSGFKTYTVPIGTANGWAGQTISRIRFDISNGGDEGYFLIDSIKVISRHVSESAIIIAGGGGGYGGRSSSLGGDGGGSVGGDGLDGFGNPGRGGSQSAGGAGGSNYGGSGSLGQGGSNTAGSNSGGGGGGGGYYGGGAGGNDYSGYNDRDDSGGGGGSGYIGGVTDGVMQSGVNSGNGKAKITSPDIPAVGPEKITREVKVPDDAGAIVIPPEAYILVPRTVDPNAAVVTPKGTFTPGNFINLDYPFQIYFPNRGHFRGNDAQGIPFTTGTRGKGFTDGMDTTEWTKSKAVKFQFNVIYDGVLYPANEWIELPVAQSTFEFYCPLGNLEAVSALVQFRAFAINSAYMDNDVPTNRVRDGSLAAKHSALKSWNIDVVGRIGNAVIEDTGDFRFSNLFKALTASEEWFVPNVVRKVNPGRQNRIVGDLKNIRGETVSATTDYLDTYGLLSHERQEPVPFPLSPEKNNISALRKQPLRLGYNVLMDIQTIGNYYDYVKIVPYYYHLDLSTGELRAVDIYMQVQGQYKPINKAEGSYADVYPYRYQVDWSKEAARRNVFGQEDLQTDKVVNYFRRSDEDAETSRMSRPVGNYGSVYDIGTAQGVELRGRSRTFIGTEKTYGDDRNPGGKLPPELFALQAQRWHFTLGLPSSAVAVVAGQAPTQAHISALRNDHSVLLMTADITALGDTYALKYASQVTISGKDWSITDFDHPVIAVYSAHKSSEDDLQVSGTH